jgi:fluoride exporter
MRYRRFMQTYLLVFVGAGLGGAIRHFVNLTVGRAFGTAFPWGTAIINVSGSFVMGLLAGWLAFRAGAEWSQSARLFAATGVLGGYTTFSSFSLEAMLLIERNETGAAAAYVGGSVLLGILALSAGLSLARSLT